MALDFGKSDWVQDLAPDYGIGEEREYDGPERWKANGKKGYFEKIGKNATESALEVEGFILQATMTRTLWAPKTSSPLYLREKQYKFPDQTPLCKWDGGSHEPRLHKDLTPTQVARLQELGCGNCNTCSLKEFSDYEGDRCPPVCSDGLAILFLPATGSPDDEIKPWVIQVNSYHSRDAFNAWVANAVRPHKIPLCAGKVKLGWKEVPNKRHGGMMSVMTLEFTELTPDSMKEPIEKLCEEFSILEPRKQLAGATANKQLPAGQDADNIPF